MNPIWKLLLGATWFIALAGILWIGFLSTTDYIKRNAQWESEWTKRGLLDSGNQGESIRPFI